MSGNRFKSRVDKVFRRYLPAHLHSNFRIIYYIEWRHDRTIQFVMWSKDGTIPFPCLKALSDMFESADLYVINYFNKKNRIPEEVDYRGNFVHWTPGRHGEHMNEKELFIIQIKNADFTKVFTHQDEDELSKEAERFELEE